MTHSIRALSFLVLPALLAATGTAQALPWTATQYAAGVKPNAVAIGDLNHDGLPDVVASNQTPGAVCALLGTGAGIVGSPNMFNVGGSLNDVAIGELNGDGNPDVVTVGSSVSVLLGVGNGNIGPATSVGLSAAAVAIGDLNGDGKADLATANGMGGNASVLLGTGSGSLTLATTYFVTSGTATMQSVALGDLNHDGALDIVTTATLPYAGVPAPDDAFVQLNNGGGLFGVPTTVAGAGSFAAIGDMNEDGNADLVTVNNVVLGSGTGAFGTPVYNSTPNLGFRRVSVADVDGDGHLDAVTPYFGWLPNVGDSILFRYGSGTGVFGTNVHLVVGLEPTSVAIGDLDQNGRVDVAAAAWTSNKVAVALNPNPTPLGVQPYGTGTWGCAGKLGLNANTMPSIGNSSFAIIGSNAPVHSLGLLIVTDLQDLAGSDPIGLGILLHAGIFGATTTVGLNAYSGPSGEQIASLPIPNNGALVGLSVYGQTIWVEPVTQRCTPGVVGLESSRGLAVTFQP